MFYQQVRWRVQGSAQARGLWAAERTPVQAVAAQGRMFPSRRLRRCLPAHSKPISPMLVPSLLPGHVCRRFGAVASASVSISSRHCRWRHWWRRRSRRRRCWDSGRCVSVGRGPQRQLAVAAASPQASGAAAICRSHTHPWLTEPGARTCANYPHAPPLTQLAAPQAQDSEEGGTKQEVASLLRQLLQQRAQQLLDWFAVEVDEGAWVLMPHTCKPRHPNGLMTGALGLWQRVHSPLPLCPVVLLTLRLHLPISHAEGNLCSLPQLIEQYIPDLGAVCGQAVSGCCPNPTSGVSPAGCRTTLYPADRVPHFVLALGQTVEWGEQEACVRGVAQVRCAWLSSALTPG